MKKISGSFFLIFLVVAAIATVSSLQFNPATEKFNSITFLNPPNEVCKGVKIDGKDAGNPVEFGSNTMCCTMGKDQIKDAKVCKSYSCTQASNIKCEASTEGQTFDRHVLRVTRGKCTPFQDCDKEACMNKEQKVEKFKLKCKKNSFSGKYYWDVIETNLNCNKLSCTCKDKVQKECPLGSGCMKDVFTSIKMSPESGSVGACGKEFLNLDCLVGIYPISSSQTACLPPTKGPISPSVNTYSDISSESQQVESQVN